jgi:hypothetical protein
MTFSSIVAEMPLGGSSANILGSIDSTTSQNSPILNNNGFCINLQVATIFY